VVAVAKTIKAEFCFDTAASVLRLGMTYETTSKVWAAVGFMDSAECLMTPRGGGDQKIVYATTDSAGAYTLSKGMLSPSMKSFDKSKVQNFNNGLTLLGADSGFVGGFVKHENGKLSVGFSKTFSSKPDSLHVSTAHGSSTELAYHAWRECFTIKDIPECPQFACNVAGPSQAPVAGVSDPIDASRSSLVASLPVLLAAFALTLS
jgi:hypothetical protein